MPRIKTQEIYNPLYTNKDKPIILITGGRGSGKSFNASTFIQRSSFKKGRMFLYTRYTMSSAGISVIPEFQEKVEADGHAKYFQVKKSDVVNRSSGAKILFRGIKTSSGNQTAKLKSIHGLTDFICDEGEEWQSEKEFDTIRLSLRKKGYLNRVFIIMNPTDDGHFIYRKFIKDTHRIEYFDGVPVQISTHPLVLHIHTTYLDNLDNLSDDFLREVSNIKENDPDKYANVVIGRWVDSREGAIFTKITQVDSIPDFVKFRGIGIDFGYTNDPTAIVECAVHDNTLYIDLVCYETGLLTNEIISRLEPYKHLDIMSESADPRLIDEIYNEGFNILPVDKYHGSIIAGIEKMKEYNICVTKRSYPLLEEYRNYIWDIDKNGNFINKPIDDWNHAIDAARYFVLGKVLGKILKPRQRKNKLIKPSGLL